jgi:hypothetical protein
MQTHIRIPMQIDSAALSFPSHLSTYLNWLTSGVGTCWLCWPVQRCLRHGWSSTSSCWVFHAEFFILWGCWLMRRRDGTQRRCDARAAASGRGLPYGPGKILNSENSKINWTEFVLSQIWHSWAWNFSKTKNGSAGNRIRNNFSYRSFSIEFELKSREPLLAKFIWNLNLMHLGSSKFIRIWLGSF